MRRLALIALILLLASVAGAQSFAVQRRAWPTTGSAASQPAVWSDNANTVATWFFEESSGTRDNVQGTADRDLTDSGTTPTITSSVMQGDRALDFDNSTRLLCTDANCGGTSALDFNGPMTVGCWAWTDVTGNLRRIWAKGTSTTTANTTGYMGGRPASGEFGCYSQATTVLASSNTFPDLKWIHVLCRRDATHTRPYVNGRPSGTNTATTAAANTAGEFRIGSRSDATGASQSWDGRIDECAAINTNASDSQICRIARCGMDGEFCACDGSTGYKSCITDVDCQQYSQKGTCDTKSGSATVNTCAGRMVGTCTGGADVDEPCSSDSECASSSCTFCTPVACNDGGP